MRISITIYKWQQTRTIVGEALLWSTGITMFNNDHGQDVQAVPCVTVQTEHAVEVVPLQQQYSEILVEILKGVSNENVG